MVTWPVRRYLPHFEISGGTCHLTWRLKTGQPPLGATERSVVLETIRNDHQARCEVLAAVVMDDHVHVLATIHEGVTSIQLAAAWKSISSHHLCRGGARQAPLWLRGTYQRWIRHGAHLPICIEYIKHNPQRKWPGVTDYPWMLP